MIVRVQRVMPGALAVVALAGCDAVFGLAEPGDAGASAVDGGVSGGPDAPLPPAGRCTQPGQEILLPVVADTYLRADYVAHGGEPVAYVAGGTAMLVRFDPGNDVFDQITLALDQADQSTACGVGGGCGPCPVPVRGQLNLYYVRPDWDEATATSAQRGAGLPWAAPGAGGTDRSMQVATVLFSGGTVSVPVSPTSTPDGWPAGLSLLVESDATTAATFATREAAPTCGTAQPPRATGRCASGLCGNDVMEPGESCDDGNVTAGDGCSEACQLEATCGNGITEVGEQCDDGNNTSSDGCANCMLEPVPL